MALELPPGLDTVLNILGVDWPQANEDEVVRLADELRKLASTIDSVQMAADKALTTLREAYHGDSADKLAELWGTISKYSRMVVDACGATATALNAAALVIEGCKGATLTQLVLTQGELAAASATGPWSTAAIIAAGKQIVSSILEEAVSALGQALAQPVGDLVETVVKDLTAGVSGPSNSPGFGVDLEKLASCAVELRRHADDIDSHGNSFRQIVEGLDVGRPGDMFGKLVIAAAEQIATSIGMEVLKRLLGSFRGTADRMDQVARNLTENEDSHTKQLHGILTEKKSLSSLSPLKLAGGVSNVTAGNPRHSSPAADDGPRPGFDRAGIGAATGGAHLPNAAGSPASRGARTSRAPGLLAPDQPSAEARPTGTSPQQPRAQQAGPHPFSTHHGSTQPAPRSTPGFVAGHQGTEPTGLGRPAMAQTPGGPDPAPYGQAPYGQAAGDGQQGQGTTGQSAQQRNTLRPREEAPSEDPVELRAAPSRDDVTPDT
ncbi:hypothetical protein GCM10010193_16380 [Kitasatospora atroaurantiaca]|uniref:Outer membrane channel protein CpnT-like N-terminal domain-containing protein n=1 Tax=Kitasatospora atroaurantiaca TaxID=285545 RepID=A0A561EXG7_9ACTN|nr:hypothetical protein [Kitasatospora atroaurantiaca]TWE20301.1 hypothetical protein FB465_5450 [Kitasatospora atroaurantiaca]